MEKNTWKGMEKAAHKILNKGIQYVQEEIRKRRRFPVYKKAVHSVLLA
jgi:hypothetical protein